MKKEIRSLGDGIVRVTTVDERWYALPTTNNETGVPDGYRFVPSVTWIAGHYPKGIGFYKWLADKGWDEALAIRNAAGDKGSRVHQAVTDLIDGKTVHIDSSEYSADGETPQPLDLGEWQCLMSFAEWWQAFQPETIERDMIVLNEDEGYAGTLDWLGVFKTPPKGVSGGPWLLDFKTGQDVWPEHMLQVSAYAHALPTDALAFASTANLSLGLGILQLGYRRNKHQKYKFTPVEDRFELFLAAKQIWAEETAGQAPLQKDYPLILSLP